MMLEELESSWSESIKTLRRDKPWRVDWFRSHPDDLPERQPITVTTVTPMTGTTSPTHITTYVFVAKTS